VVGWHQNVPRSTKGWLKKYIAEKPREPFASVMTYTLLRSTLAT